MKLQKPDLTFYHDKNDPDDVGGWALMWGEYRVCLTSEHANPDALYIYISRETGDDDESAIIYMNGRIDLGAYGRVTSFHDMDKCLNIRQAVLLLNSIKP